MKWKIVCAAIGVLLFLPILTRAQEHRKSFGQNRLQFKRFDWFYYSTDNYDIHYYNNGQEYAKLALEYLQSEYDQLTDLLGYAPYAKSKIFLYNSPSDLLQSNIGVDGATFTIAGQTNFIKLQVEIAYPGTVSEFKEELHYKVSKMLIEDMMFGGSLAEMFQSAYLLNLPEWFVTGASRYMAYGWDVEMDDFVRDYFANEKKKKLTKVKNLQGEEAELIGQSIWNYIALKYGKSNISNILNLTRIIRNVEHSIASTLGIPFSQFMTEWMEYYNKSNMMVAPGYYAPGDADIIEGDGRKQLHFKNVKFSPDGRRVAYSENVNGRYKLKIKDLETGKEEKAFVTGNNVINQEADFDLPLVEWITDTQIGVVQNWYGFNYLLTYDLVTKQKQRKSLQKFNQIKSISFHRNGKLAIISADVEAQNDLYLISLSRNAIKRLTRDQWDDLDPSFVPGTDAIVFSSNRPSDSLDHKMTTVEEVKQIFNLFVYDLDTTKKVLKRLTNTLSNDTKPMALDNKTIFFLSDQKGITNLYRYELSNQINYQVSSFSTSIQDYDIDPKTNDITYLMHYDGKERLFHTKNFLLDKNVFSPQTLRNQLKQVEFLRKRREEQTVIEVIEAPEEKEPDPVDESTGEKLLDTDHYVFEQEKNEQEKETTGVVDTENYEFEDEPEDTKSFSFLSNYRKAQKTPTVTGPLPYETAISADNVITSFVIDPIRGFGILFETEMNDVLENHKFYGGFLSITDLRSGDFFAEYQYIKHKIDFHTRFDRKSFLIENNITTGANSMFNEVAQKYILNSYTVGASLPFSVHTRLKVSPFVAFTTFNNLNPSYIENKPLAADFADDSRRAFAGVKTELIFDNAQVNGLNLYEGTRAKVAFQSYGGITDSDKSFNNITVDIRHYQKIYRELILASRIYYGRSYGSNPKKYLLGGLDNWLFNKTEETSLGSGILDGLPNGRTPDVALSESSPLNFNNGRDNSEILFAEYVNLRGFNYNRLNGNNVLTFNTELRVPIVKIFHRGSITSNFLRNFQMIGFYDIGSSWTGTSPFSENNEVGIKEIKPQGSPFQATLRTTRSPWLASYGFGLRTVMLGYYMRFDFAKPIEDYTVGDMKFYLTLGYDF